MKFHLFDLLDHAELVVIDLYEIDEFKYPQGPGNYWCACGDEEFTFAPQVVDVVGNQVKVVDLGSECEVLIKFWKKVPMTEADFDGHLFAVA
jgi:hypothetical protein